MIYPRAEHVEGIHTMFHLAQSQKPAETATTAVRGGFKNRLIDLLSVRHLSCTFGLATQQALTSTISILFTGNENPRARAMFEYTPPLNFAIGSLGQFMSIGHTAQDQTFCGLACWNRTSSHFGEYDRYSKEHQSPISIDRVPVHIPPAVKAAKYTKYKHTRLARQDDEARLLELLPSVWSKSQDFVPCHFLRSKRSENPQYEALSYTWGTLARDVPIFAVPNPLPDGLVVSDALPTMPQLYAALKRLRLVESVSTLVGRSDMY